MHDTEDADGSGFGIDGVEQEITVPWDYGLTNARDILPAAAIWMLAEHLRRSLHGIRDPGGRAWIMLSNILDDDADLNQGAAGELDPHRRKWANAAVTSSAVAMSPRRTSSSPCATRSR